MLEERVGAQHGVVRLYNSGGEFRRWVNAKVELGLLAIVYRETLEEQRTESRASSSSNRVEDEKSLETSASISNLADSLEGEVYKFLSNSVVSSGVVIGGIFLSRKELVRIEELSVSTVSHFIDDRGFQVDKDGSRDVLSTTGIREEGAKGVLFLSRGRLVRRLDSIRSDAMFQAVQLPARISQLDSGLANVNRDNFSHGFE
jgi:hypothetical protein